MIKKLGCISMTCLSLGVAAGDSPWYVGGQVGVGYMSGSMFMDLRDNIGTMGTAAAPVPEAGTFSGSLTSNNVQGGLHMGRRFFVKELECFVEGSTGIDRAKKDFSNIEVKDTLSVAPGIATKIVDEIKQLNFQRRAFYTIGFGVTYPISKAFNLDLKINAVLNDLKITYQTDNLNQNKISSSVQTYQFSAYPEARVRWLIQEGMFVYGSFAYIPSISLSSGLASLDQYTYSTKGNSSMKILSVGCMFNI